jgi:tetratricopeptide (TPR) repeat protein
LPTAADDDKPDDAKPADAADARRAKKGRRALPKVSALSQDERVTEDLSVAKFYSSRGNYEAAYLRSKDATTLMPDDAESHYRLAEAAQKLKKNDEAITEYNLYLKLDPGGDWAEAAQKALLDLKKGG